MTCKEVEYGTFDCSYVIYTPWKYESPFTPDDPPKEKLIAVDKCLLPEILKLWEMGIKTTGCCCGHGRDEPYIGVFNEYIDKMKQLGYKVQFNPCRPNGEDTFYPKTEFNYGEIDKGFHKGE